MKINEQDLTVLIKKVLNENNPSFKEIMARVEQEKERVKIEKEKKVELIKQRILDRNTPEKKAERLEMEMLKKQKEDEAKALHLRDRADDYYTKTRGATITPGYQELLRKRAEKDKAKQMEYEYNEFIKKMRDELQVEKMRDELKAEKEKIARR